MISQFSLLSFNIVLEALSWEIKSGYHEEFLWANDLVLVSESLNGLKG